MMSPLAHSTCRAEGEKAACTTGTWSGWMTCFPVKPMRTASSDCFFSESRSRTVAVAEEEEVMEGEIEEDVVTGRRGRQGGGGGGRKKKGEGGHRRKEEEEEEKFEEDVSEKYKQRRYKKILV